MFNDVDFDFTVNDLLAPGISNTIFGAEPTGQMLPFLTDLFPNANFNSGFTRVQSTFKIDDDIVLFYFDEAVSAGKGNIVISSDTDTDTRFIDVNDTDQVRFGAPGYHSRNAYHQNREEFGVVTINPSTDLLLDAVYTIQVAEGVFLDSKGNPQPGFNSGALKTIDSSPNFYVFNEVIPIDGNIQLHFDEAVKAATGEIVISNGTDVRTIAIDDTSQVTFEGDTVTVNLADDLLPDSTYVLQIESGVITDEEGHPNKGLLSSSYRTYPATPISQPLLVDSNPREGSSDFKADNNITLRFDEAVKAGTGNLVFSNGIDTRIIAINDKNQVTFDGRSVIINPTEDLVSGTTYTAQMASGVITDKTGTPYAGFSDAIFSTIDSGPYPYFESGHRFSHVKTDQNIRFSFDEEIAPGSGNIIISDGLDMWRIDIKDTDQVTFDLGLVSINPTTDLSPNATYLVQIPQSAITDTQGNSLSTENYQIIWETTNSMPLIVGSYPIDGGNIKSDQPIVLRFDEKIMAGSGDLVLSNGTDHRSIAMTDSNQVIFNGRSVIIDPTVDWVPGTTYTAQMVSGAIVDSEGNAYGGFSDASFTVNEISLVGLVQT